MHREKSGAFTLGISARQHCTNVFSGRELENRFGEQEKERFREQRHKKGGSTLEASSLYYWLLAEIHQSEQEGRRTGLQSTKMEGRYKKLSNGGAIPKRSRPKDCKRSKEEEEKKRMEAPFFWGFPKRERQPSADDFIGWMEDHLQGKGFSAPEKIAYFGKCLKGDAKKWFEDRLPKKFKGLAWLEVNTHWERFLGVFRDEYQVLEQAEDSYEVELVYQEPEGSLQMEGTGVRVKDEDGLWNFVRKNIRKKGSRFNKEGSAKEQAKCTWVALDTRKTRKATRDEEVGFSRLRDQSGSRMPRMKTWKGRDTFKNILDRAGKREELEELSGLLQELDLDELSSAETDSSDQDSGIQQMMETYGVKPGSTGKKESRRCFKCATKGHLARDCWPGPPTPEEKEALREWRKQKRREARKKKKEESVNSVLAF